MTNATAHAAIRYAASSYARNHCPRLDPLFDSAATAARAATAATNVAGLLEVAQHLAADRRLPAARAIVGLSELALDYVPTDVRRYLDDAFHETSATR